MKESDKNYYERIAIQDEKRKRALSKANNRGVASVEWHKNNKLTPETLSDFKKAMKQADKEWESNN